MSTLAKTPRIISLDQFRGYTVVGMIVVNYLGSFAVIHPVLKHHNTYFSYADTIMPAFHFAVGFALRLTLLRRLQTDGKREAYLHVVRRCLGLILLSTVLEFAGDRGVRSWSALAEKGLWGTIAGPLKCDFWETLALIGVTSLWVLPVIAAGRWIRILFMIGCIVLHVALAQLFYFDFMYARPTVLDPIWGATDVKGLDGGPLGFLAWSIPQLLGSLAYDAVAVGRTGAVVRRLFAWSVALMALGYGLSCISRYYPATQPPTTSEGGMQVAASPVLPPFTSVVDYRLASPPFVQPPADEQRQLNYWLMAKRMVTLPFNIFSAGFCLAIYAFLVLVCDLGGWTVGLFRTLGQNALAAYVIHEAVGRAVAWFTPFDSPLAWVAVTFIIYCGITYLFVRHLEKNGIFLRL